MPPTLNSTITSPASLIQQQFWLINEMHPGNSAYNIASVFQLKGKLNITALGKSFQTLLSRHHILRTSFEQENGQLTQVVSSDFSFKLNTIQLDYDGSTEKATRIENLIKDEIVRPFDLHKGPLFRASLIKENETTHHLAILMHHIITDLRSKDIFSKELSECYSLFTQDMQPGVEDEQAQYDVYAKWQKEWIDTSDCQKMMSFWQSQLSGQSDILNLPTDKPRLSDRTLTGGHIPFEFEVEFSQALRKLSKELNADTFLILLAAYIALLYKYSHQEDIVIGVPLTNRRQEKHKNILGCFVNILPLSFKLSADMPFTELLKQVRQKMLLAHRNQELPFIKILETVNPDRHRGTNALFQTGFTVEPPMHLALEGLAVIPKKIHNEGSQLDLFLSFIDIEETIKGYFEYSCDLFHKETIERLSGHYQNLLKTIILHPETTIGSIDPLSPAEKERLIVDLNQTEMAVPDSVCIHQLFEQQVERSPDAVAARFQDEQLTYSGLNARANQLAHLLISFGVGAGTMVGVFLHRSLDMMTAIYAILKTGAAYVPLDPAFPHSRLEYILEDTKATILITQTALEGHLKTEGLRNICLDRSDGQSGKHPKHNPACQVTPDATAYVLHTSGSTGKPKGVQVPHNAVVNFLLSMQQEPGIEPKDTLVAVTTLSFDISVLELFLPLITGAKVVIADQATVTNGEALLDLIRSSGATLLQATPITWHLLLAAGMNRATPLKILCGGENLPPGLATRLCDVSDSVWNLYGPTETTIWSTCARIVKNQPVTAGRPIANTQLYIVDKHLNLTPQGVPGELLIGGKGVSLGYLNKPQLTAEKFIPDHIGSRAGRRLYRTGDLARYLPDGQIEILGRMDHQVKLRGFRIELGEIEAVLSKHPAVKQAAVIIHAYSEADQRLVAYYTAKSDQSPSHANLREFLQKELPDYMLPAIYTQLEKMPLTDNGKINRKALPAPARESIANDAAFVAPKTDTEKMLCALWQEILGIDSLGTSQNFFEIGGNSLLAVEVVARLQTESNRKLSVVELFQHPTVASLAERLAQEVSTVSKKVIDRAKMQRQAIAKKRRKPLK